MTKEQIDQKYLDQAKQLEDQYFKIVYEVDDQGRVIGQHRELKRGRKLDEFNRLHAEIWRNHEAELIANGYLGPVSAPLPVDPLTELSELKQRIQALEAMLIQKSGGK